MAGHAARDRRSLIFAYNPWCRAVALSPAGRGDRRAETLLVRRYHLHSDGAWVSLSGWTGGYVPALVRRYPFILGEVEGAEPIMCFDEAYEGLSEKIESGTASFVNEAEESLALKGVIQLVNDYRVAADRTEAFCAALHDFGLLKSITINVQIPGRDNHVVHGLLVIDLDKLNGLGDDDFLAFRHDGHLPHIYAHLASLVGIERLGSLSAQSRERKV